MPNVEHDHEQFRSLVREEIAELQQWRSDDELSRNRLFRCYQSAEFFEECFPNESVRQRYLAVLRAAEENKPAFAAADDDLLRRAFFLTPANDTTTESH